MYDSFVKDVWLFCQVYRALLSNIQGSFVKDVGLFCLVYRALLSVWLFCQVYRALLSNMQGSFVKNVGLICPSTVCAAARATSRPRMGDTTHSRVT